MDDVDAMSVEVRIEQARRLLEARLDEDVPLEEAAAASSYSMFHFHRLFRGLIGETVREHVRRLRLERAAFRLVHTTDDILPIALDAGYETHESFSRAFKAHFGEPPSAYRASGREVIRQRGGSKEQTMDVTIRQRPGSRIAYVR
ncbi:MAG: helix-turn-helix transcriptional regulator, partial [Phycisphaerales bacterium]|nr:helix-turn-helix transcriptional regulator [Phycisphaerales bacterium]